MKVERNYFDGSISLYNRFIKICKRYRNIYITLVYESHKSSFCPFLNINECYISCKCNSMSFDNGDIFLFFPLFLASVRLRQNEYRFEELVPICLWVQFFHPVIFVSKVYQLVDRRACFAATGHVQFGLKICIHASVVLSGYAVDQHIFYREAMHLLLQYRGNVRAHVNIISWTSTGFYKG